jgi:D-xylose transport system substrate-binding protein
MVKWLPLLGSLSIVSAPTAVATSAPTAAVAPTSAAAAPTAAPIGVGGTIALLLPETKTTRYETADRPDFEQQFKQLCPNCTIIYSNANQGANAQLAQAEAALTNGARRVAALVDGCVGLAATVQGDGTRRHRNCPVPG